MATWAMCCLQRTCQSKPVYGTSAVVRAIRSVTVVSLLLLAGTDLSAAEQAINVAVPSNSCSGCHGQSSSRVLPALSLLSADEVEVSMLAFKNGTRPATLMNRIARGFTDEEIRQLAVWVTQ